MRQDAFLDANQNRTHDQFARLIQSFGATPVTLQFSEVYPALQRGVANCGVTSPTSGNSGNVIAAIEAAHKAAARDLTLSLFGVEKPTAPPPFVTKPGETIAVRGT